MSINDYIIGAFNSLRSRMSPSSGKLVDEDNNVFDLTKFIKDIFDADNGRVKVSSGNFDDEGNLKVAVKSPLEENGGLPVNLQDQTTQTIDDKFCRAISASKSLASETVAGGYTIELNDASGLSAGDEIGLFQDSDKPQSYFGKILSISTNTLTMDMPLPIAFRDSSHDNPAQLFEIDCDMSKDGSSTPIIYSIFNGGSQPIDITRILIQMDTASVPQFDEFGDLTALTKGCVLRKKKADGEYQNIADWKSNQDLALYMYDLDLLSSFFGANGVKGRMTFGGQEKHGVVIRLAQNEALEFIVQDNLTGLNEFRVLAQGHFTTNS